MSNLVEYLGCLVLDGLDLDLVWRILPLSVSHCFLQPQDAIERNRMTPSPLELIQVFHQVLRAGEETGGLPHQLPPSFLR